MPARQSPRVISPLEVDATDDRGPFPFDLYARKCLAQGDSWFSIGALPPTRTSRVLDELKLLHSTVIVNCAVPGARLHRMTDTTRAFHFVRLLTGRFALKWDVILLSGGGNDLIEALGVAPEAASAARLLKTPEERGPGPAPDAGHYINEAGWQTFCQHLQQVFDRLLDLKRSGINRATPLVWHNYARVMPRNAPAGLGFGPWLLPALQRYAVPVADRLMLADELLGRLARLVGEMVAAAVAADPGARLFVADSMAAGVTLAAAESRGVSGDWVNEIHLTRGGYRKCCQKAWEPVLDPLLHSAPT